MASVKLILRTHQADQTGHSPLYIRIIKDRKTKFITAGVNTTSFAGLTVDTSGNIVASFANATLTGLDTIAYLPATASGVTWTNITTPLSNSWTNSVTPTESPARYALDAMTRVHLQGAVVPGTTTTGTTIFALPAATQISRKLIAPTIATNGFYPVDVGTTGIVTRAIAPGAKLHLNFIYFPTAYASWTTMTLVNSWVVFDTTTNASPEYTKAADNIVTLKGLIRTGTVTSGTLLTTLPAGYRPNATLSFPQSCNNAVCRIEVESDGEVRGYGLNATYSGMNAINFRADQ